MGIGLYSAPNHDHQYSIPSMVHLNHSTPLESYLYFSNQIPDPTEFFVFVLVDFRQVPFEFEGDDANILCNASVDPYEGKFFSITVSNLTRGKHDMAIILAMEPNNHSMDPSFRLSTDLSSVRGIRLNLIVDNDTHYNIEYDNSTNPLFKQCSSDYPLNDGLLMTKEACSNKLWYTESGIPDENIPYWINCAAGDDYPNQFAIITLMDYQQVPINTNSSQYAIFGNLSPGEKIAIPSNVMVPKETGLHEFMAVWIPFPFEYHDYPSGSCEYCTQDKGLASSVRIGLNVSRLPNVVY